MQLTHSHKALAKPATQRLKPIAVTGFFDATADDIAGEIDYVCGLYEAEDGYDLHGPFDFNGVKYNRPSLRTRTSSFLAGFGRIALAASVGLGLVGGCLLGAGAPLGAALFVGGLCGVGSTVLATHRAGYFKDGLGLLKSAFNPRHEPGTTLIHQSPDATRKRRVEHRPDQARPNPEDLQSMVIAQMKAHPSSYHVTLMFGHGDSTSSAGLSSSNLKRALVGASQKMGRKTDLLILDSCETARLGNLANLAPSAHYTLAGPYPLSSYGIRAHSVSKPMASSEELVKSVVDAQDPRYSDLVGLDNSSLREALLPALDNLGKQMLAARLSGDRVPRRAIKAGRSANVAGHRVNGQHGSRVLGFGRLNLGALLRKLEREARGSLKQSALAALEAYDRTVLAAGPSADIYTNWVSDSLDPNVPDGWQKLLKSITLSDYL